MPASMPTSVSEEVFACRPSEEPSCCGTKPDLAINDKPISVFTSVQTDNLNCHPSSRPESPGRKISTHGSVLGAGASDLKWRSKRTNGTGILQSLLPCVRKGSGPASSLQPDGSHGTVGHAKPEIGDRAIHLGEAKLGPGTEPHSPIRSGRAIHSRRIANRDAPSESPDSEDPL